MYNGDDNDAETPGGLKKADLFRNAKKQYVSRKASESCKRRLEEQMRAASAKRAASAAAKAKKEADRRRAAMV